MDELECSHTFAVGGIAGDKSIIQLGYCHVQMHHKKMTEVAEIIMRAIIETMQVKAIFSFEGPGMRTTRHNLFCSMIMNPL